MRLIDADAVLEELKRMEVELMPAKLAHIYTAVVVEDAPTIDAVPVVRCKDCKHLDPEDKKCDCGHTILWQLPRDDDWFCADGERREDE